MYFKDKNTRITFRCSQTLYNKLADKLYFINNELPFNISLADYMRNLLEKDLCGCNENKSDDFND